MDENKEPTWYEIPEGALVVPESGGRHWLHLKTAEQLARAMWECKSFDIRRLYQAGGISEGNPEQPEGLVALRNGQGQLLLMGSYITDGLQWPTSPAGDSSIALREEYAKEIANLQEKAVELLPIKDRTVALQF
ncbi:hypothetical protein [Rhizobium sp. MHM7A]|uniref:hypothetical protein n=1 Tax=Rhizobium sp. MHM7A TaxID=2583233 RepID=UPI0011075A5E|nr:hypothetical protein [Rhizobium sp. MHM7A]TLX16005.1 hypothetical protein FFR93_01420 [Rhizobium sp. MHM7A]